VSLRSDFRVNPGFEPETNIAMDIMQPIGGMKFPVEMADPRYSLFPEFESNCSSIKSSQSSKSMLSITSNRSKEQKDEHETVSHMNTPSGLMSFLRQSIFKVRFWFKPRIDIGVVRLLFSP
jgi:hypothetical protein